MKKLLAGIASILSVAACGENAPYGSNVNYSARDSVKDYFFSATSRGPLFVDVRGTYPGFDEMDVTDVILRGMEKGMQTRPFKATPNMEEAHSPDYRVYWLIAPPKNFNNNRLCKGELPQSVAQDKPTFSIVFCVGDDVYRDISGWVHTDVVAGSENFTKFVGVVTRELFK
ncbi:hypothetical protein RYZ26_18825 [Terasakiella sp. A23]|uniref:hypothetical protein n=1 Tax=Terasakiella sp. FCG-A23 TaxID=3080561 RepID=UPI002955A9BE|nr:hypothetical protein [Terasakiella sp. A23]MDV7341662.1 hypothetical protein [Terasakiella sp. A23]